MFISFFIVNTSIFVTVLFWWSTVIQGTAPAQYSGYVPTTFIEGELHIGGVEGVISVPVPGDYDIYDVRYQVEIDYEKIPEWNLTEIWGPWTLDKVGDVFEEIVRTGTSSSERKAGTVSLWYDVQHSNKSNTWIAWFPKQPLNLSGYSALIFQIRTNTTVNWKYPSVFWGGETGLYFGNGEWNDQIWFRLDLKPTTEWQTYIVPLSSFITKGNPSWEKISYVILTLHGELGSPDYRVWLDGWSFIGKETRLAKTLLFINGVEILSSGSQHIWTFADAYGINADPLMSRNIVIVPGYAWKFENLTLMIRLYPSKYYYYGRVNASDWTGICIDRYEWDSLGELAKSLDNLSLAIGGEIPVRLSINGNLISIDCLQRSNSTIFGTTGEIIVMPLLKVPAQLSSTFNVTIELRGEWYQALFYSTHRTLWPIREGLNLSYKATIIYVAVNLFTVILYLSQEKNSSSLISDAAAKN